MNADEMGDLFWSYVRANNPDDKEKLGLKFANALTDTLRRLEALESKASQTSPRDTK